MAPPNATAVTTRDYVNHLCDELGRSVIDDDTERMVNDIRHESMSINHTPNETIDHGKHKEVLDALTKIARRHISKVKVTPAHRGHLNSLVTSWYDREMRSLLGF